MMKLYSKPHEAVPGPFPSSRILLKKCNPMTDRLAWIQKGGKRKRHAATGILTVFRGTKAAPTGLLYRQLSPKKEATTPSRQPSQSGPVTWSNNTLTLNQNLYCVEERRDDFTCFKRVHLKHRFPNSGIVHQKVKRGLFCTRTDFRLTGFTCFLPVLGEPLQFLFSQDSPYRLLSNTHQMLNSGRTFAEGTNQGLSAGKTEASWVRVEVLLCVDNLNTWHSSPESFIHTSKYFFSDVLLFKKCIFSQ